MHFLVMPQHNGEYWDWTLVGRNGKHLATSVHPYTSPENAYKAIERFVNNLAEGFSVQTVAYETLYPVSAARSG